jgi:hypothetical protein
MTTMQADKLVDDYMRQLEAAAAHLQRSRRAELVAEIREHIDAALRAEDEAGEAAVRNVLERLGPPEEIVEAAEPPQAAASRPRGGGLEIAALIALLVPVIGWLVGIVLVLVSAAWSARDKLVGIGLLVLVLLLPAVGITSESSGVDAQPVPPLDTVESTGLPEAGGGSGVGSLEILVLTVMLLAGLPSVLYLGLRLRRPHRLGQPERSR